MKNFIFKKVKKVRLEIAKFVIAPLSEDIDRRSALMFNNLDRRLTTLNQEQIDIKNRISHTKQRLKAVSACLEDINA